MQGRRFAGIGGSTRGRREHRLQGLEQITEAGTETGVKKAGLSRDKALVASFLAGAYIAFGALLAITVSSGLSEGRWGALPTLFTGAAERAADQGNPRGLERFRAAGDRYRERAEELSQQFSERGFDF